MVDIHGPPFIILKLFSTTTKACRAAGQSREKPFSALKNAKAETLRRNIGVFPQ
jgi:hypothetical protein